MKRETPNPKVLHVVTRLGLGGAEAVAVSIAEGLHHELPAAIFAVRGVRRNAVGQAMELRLRTARIPLFQGPSWPLKAGGMIPAAIALRRAIARTRPDVVHLHTEIPEAAQAFLPAAEAARSRFGLVRTIHSTACWTFWPRLGRWCENRLRHGMPVAVSRAALEGFRTHLRRSQLPEPGGTCVVYNGVQPPREARFAKSRTRHPTRVLYAGRLDWDKGADLLPEIIRRIPNPDGGAQLTVHGEGRQGMMLRWKFSRQAGGWTVRVLPPTSELADVFAEHDILIMPSRVEGLGLVAIEASLHGLPVVASDAGGLREALPPDHPWMPAAGDADAFARALSDALTRPQARETAARRANQLARERFDPRVMLESYAALYRTAARQRGNAGS